MLKIENLSTSYKTIDGDVHVLKDINFEIKDNEIFGIAGESGCGKTTLGRTILQLHEPTSGKIVYDGETIFEGQDPWQRDAEGQLHHAKVPKAKQANMLPYRRKMQIIFQDPSASLDPRMTVGEIIGEALDIHKLFPNKQDRTDRIKELLGRVGLNTEHANRYPHEFSGGQQQRVGIARAYCNEPLVMLLDEPFGHLDAQTRYLMQDELTRIWQAEKRTVIFVTNNIEEAVYLADRILVLRNCPTGVKAEYEINLPRPRNYTDPEFLRLRREIDSVVDHTL